MKRLIDCKQPEKAKLLQQIQRGNFNPEFYKDDTIVIESEKDDWIGALVKGKDRFICLNDGLLSFTHRLNNHAEGLKKLA